MEKWTTLRATAAPMMEANIDTGALAPVIVNRLSAKTYSERLFGNQRFDLDGEEVPDFVLNQPRYREAKILVAGRNFGCGSSRETAVWSLAQYGFRAVIAPSFGEIFYDNSFQNGLLLIALPEDEVQAIATAIGRAREPTLTVDLERNIITLPEGGGDVPFSVPEERRTALLEGLDDLAILFRRSGEVDAFRATDRTVRPWIYG
jgi:3-isopropylmalate/(R)-2-methylmalate dehydratase small subunit